MIKLLTKILIILFSVVVFAILYLTFFGINTKQLNNHINSQVLNINPAANLELKKKEKESQTVESSKSEIGWGHQIRSYVLHPYRMVKDNRTNFESSNPDKILDGEIDDFLESSLYKVK